MVRGRQATAAARKAAAESKEIPVDLSDDEKPVKEDVIEIKNDVKMFDIDEKKIDIDLDENITSNLKDDDIDKTKQEFKEEQPIEIIDDTENEVKEDDINVDEKSEIDTNKDGEPNEVEGLPSAEVEKKEQPPLTEEDLAYIDDLLKTKTKVGDGSEVIMFSFGPPLPGLNKKRNRSIICHLCKVANMVRPSGIKQHIAGKRHKENLNKKNIVKERFKGPYLLFYSREDEQVKQFKIFPGENIEAVTPEYEDRLFDKTEWDLKPVEAELVESLSSDPIYEYNKMKPVIGIDYMLKMKLKNTVKCFCVLCETLMENDSAYEHLTNIQHQATYIIKHFPKLYEKVVRGLTSKVPQANENNVRNIFRKLYRKIEVKHGFKKMITVDGADFRPFQFRYINKVRKMPHYNEKTIDFTDAEVNVLISKCNQNIPFNRPDPPMLPISCTVEQTTRKRKAPNAPEAPVVKSVRQNVSQGNVTKGKKNSPDVDKTVEGIKALYKKYRQNPESHPEYKKEWRQFWHERCEQLKKENINPDTYNFEKDWKAHWIQRVRKLYLKSVFEHKTQGGQTSGLAADANRRKPNPINQRVASRRRNIFMEKQQQIQPNDFSPINMRQFNNFASMLHNQQNFANFGLDTFHGGVDGRYDQRGNRNAPRPPKQIKNQEFMGQPQKMKPAVRPRRSEPVGVISVLRLLTAFEDQLGSLGPKSVQLLGKAVLSEKNKQTQELLTDSDFYVFFATAKEKLKGQIYANVVENSKIEAIKGAIKDLTEITNIMDRANRNGTNFKADNSLSQQGGENVGGRNMGTHNNGKFANNNNDGFESNRGSNAARNFRNANNWNNNMNEVSNFRSNDFIPPKDIGNYQSNYNNDDVNGRYSNFGNTNFDGSNNGGNLRNFNDIGNFSNPNNMVASNFRSNYEEMANSGGGSSNYAGALNNRANYRSDNSMSDFISTNEFLSNYRGGNDGVENFSSGGNSFGNRNNNNMSYLSGPDQQHQSGGVFNNTAFNPNASNFGRGGNTVYSSASQSGSWISGHVHSNAKPNNMDFVFNSDTMGQSNSFSLANNGNSSSNYGNFGGNFDRYSSQKF